MKRSALVKLVVGERVPDGRIFRGWKCKHGGPNSDGRTCHLLKATKQEIDRGHLCTPVAIFRKESRYRRALSELVEAGSWGDAVIQTQAFAKAKKLLEHP